MKRSILDCSPTGKVIVDDASAFFAGLPLSLPLKHITTSLVVNEIKDVESKKVLERSIELGRVVIIDPSPDYIKRAEDVAKSAGTLRKLSKTDISVLALALQLSAETNCKVYVATDDYALQHTLIKAHLSIIRVRYRGIKG
jgi:rRNA maturation endonuclease Nob1